MIDRNANLEGALRNLLEETEEGQRNWAWHQAKNLLDQLAPPETTGMKASELIRHLQALIVKHGDLVVSVYDCCEVYEIVSPPVIVDVQDDSYFLMSIN
jgi:hypothetical protein